MRARLLQLATVIALHLLVAASPALTQSTTDPRDLRTPPPTDGSALDVTITCYVNDVLAINDATQTMTVDFFTVMRWKDTRCAGQARQLNLSEVWHPRLQLMNERRLFPKMDKRVEVLPDGTVAYTQRMIGDVSIRVHLGDFPVDRHVLALHFVSPGEDRFGVRLLRDLDRSGQADVFTVADWEIGPGSFEEGRYTVESVGLDFAQLSYQFEVSRRAGFAVWQIFLPVTLVLLMSWVVFWADADQLPVSSQIALSATSMLTIIAYRLALAGKLPRVSYQTRLDLFLQGATLLVLLALVEVVVMGRLATGRSPEAAKQLDRVSRVVFPAAYVAVTLGSFWH